MTLACLTVGALIVGVACALMPSVGDVASCDVGDVACEARLQLLAFGIFGLPGVVLVAAGGRIGARARDRQLAALRLLGVSGRSITVIVASEIAVLAALAVVVAVVLLGSVVSVGQLQMLRVTAASVGYTATAVVVIGVGSAVLAAHGLAREPGAVVRERPRRHPTTWALAPLGIGLGLVLGSAAAKAGGDGVGSSPVWVLGLVLTAVGLPLGVPVIVRLAGRVLTRDGARPAARLVGRGLQFDARASTRLLATLTTMTFVAVIVQGMWADYVSGPLTAGALHAQATGPNDVVVDLGRGARELPATGRVDVLDARPLRVANCADGTCAGLLVATCADYRWLVEDPSAWCDPDRPFTLGARPDVPTEVDSVVWRTDADAEPQQVALSFRRGEPPTDQEPTGLQSRGDIVAQQLSAVVPPRELGDPTAQEWVVSLSPGLGQHAELAAEVGAVTVEGIAGGFDEYTTAIGYRTIILGALLTAFAAGMSAVVLLGVDGAIERRHAAARLTRLGVPRRVVTGTYLVAQVAPLIVGLPIAALLGALAYGVALYEPVVGVTPTPLAVAAQTSAVALIGSVVVSVVIGLGLAGPSRATSEPTRRTGHAGLRRA